MSVLYFIRNNGLMNDWKANKWTKYQWLSQNITSIFIDSSKISTLEYYKALFKNSFKNKIKVNIYE